jgi:hypothetical protein
MFQTHYMYALISYTKIKKSKSFSNLDRFEEHKILVCNWSDKDMEI